MARKTKTCSILSFGGREDAKTWRDACRSRLDYKVITTIRKVEPTTAAVRNFFSKNDDWLYIAGHASGPEVFNRYPSERDPREWTRRVIFEKDRIHILSRRTDKSPTSMKTLRKKVDFLQHQRVRAIFWGGCNVHVDPKVVATLHELFEKPLMIGWTDQTGWEILQVVMGGFGNKPPNPARSFFDRLVSGDDEDPEKVMRAWLEAASATSWGNPDRYSHRFSVILPDGKEWVLSNGAIVRGRSF